ncbi:MKRN2 opposite strand protein [Pezoporus flaviventris]|uniref:MKRN2 opposite strand protein n=1 Tax=Pezoporus flaviventris TaxID=889875 RepID=UPI002AAF30D9|nr:MKRN2 opposite strand protein [Pezoporus flaviventris]
MAEAAILRVVHCGSAIFCRRAPPRCPVCGRPLPGGLRGAPLRLPAPFRHGHRQPRSFLLRPAAPRGGFRGYDGNSDLHVGITNSNGVVYNYDEEGIHRDEAGWEECISIPLVQPDMFELLEQWDKLLEEFSVREAWLPHRYDEKAYNCYTYALAFINSILTTLGKQQMSKSEFTERFVIPHTKRASRYITLHQELTAKEFYIVPLPEQEKQCSK